MIPYTYNSLVHAGKPEQGDGPFYIEGIETKTLVEKTGSKPTKYTNGRRPSQAYL